ADRTEAEGCGRALGHGQGDPRRPAVSPQRRAGVSPLAEDVDGQDRRVAAVTGRPCRTDAGLAKPAAAVRSDGERIPPLPRGCQQPVGTAGCAVDIARDPDRLRGDGGGLSAPGGACAAEPADGVTASGRSAWDRAPPKGYCQP